jgi:hypothetical protein
MERSVLQGAENPCDKGGLPMTPNPHAKLAKAYLDELCRTLDHKQKLVRRHREWWRSAYAVPVAMGLAVGLVHCGGTVEKVGDTQEQCDNGVDDDGDEKVDCADSDCASAAGCATAEYAAPFETCDNGADDDGDGQVDCEDVDCRDDGYCMPSPAYMAPIEFDCGNGVDDEGDGLVDCADPDCGYHPLCSAEYAAPFETCDNGADDDFDGDVDCADADCLDDPACQTQPAYAAPWEHDCTNGVDDDFDGDVDCADAECVSNPYCGAAAYMAPMEVCDNGFDDDGDGLVDCADDDCISFPACDTAMYAAP